MDIKEITWFEESNLKCTATLDLQNCGSVVFSIIDNDDNEFCISRPSYNFTCNAKKGPKSIIYGFDKITRVDKTMIYYTGKTVTGVGSTRVTYNGEKVVSIGRTAIQYTSNKVTKIGNTQLSYNGSKLVAVGRAKIVYFGNKIERIEGSVK